MCRLPQLYDGWDLIEETDLAGVKQLEVIHGEGVDEPALYTAADGVTHALVQERNGSVLGVLGADGTLEERYTYSPYGKVKRHEAPRLDSARIEGGGLVLRLTDEADVSSAKDAIAVTPAVEGEWSVSADGRELKLLPPDKAPEDGRPDWPAGGVTVSVSRGLRAWTGLALVAAASVTFDATDLSARVLADWEPPRVERVAQETDGTLLVVGSERLDGADLAGAFTLREGVERTEVAFAASIDGTTVRVAPTQRLTAGEGYELELGGGSLRDLSGKAVPPATWRWTAANEPTRVWDDEETPAGRASAVGNRWFFQGRELDAATGLYDFRNRWYSPGLGRWLTRDPLGYPDGPNAYAGFGGDPANGRDPMGTFGLNCTPEGCTQMSDAAEWAALEAAGAPDSYKYGVIQQYSGEWPTVRGRATLMTSGYMAEAGLREAGKMWAIGAASVATGGTAGYVAGTLGASTFTVGFLGLTASGLGGQGASDAFAGQVSSKEDYANAVLLSWAIGAGSLGGARALTGVPLGSAALTPLELGSIEWGPQPIVINPRLQARLAAWKAYQAGGGDFDMRSWVAATQRQYGGVSGGYRSGYAAWERSLNPHGNSAASKATTWLYSLEDLEGNFLKWGITQNPEGRYPQSFMYDKRLVPTQSGTRQQMLLLERGLVETRPGPLNREPWAGAGVR